VTYTYDGDGKRGGEVERDALLDLLEICDPFCNPFVGLLLLSTYFHAIRGPACC
jgi:hypothetical protein